MSEQFSISLQTQLNRRATGPVILFNRDIFLADKVPC